MLPKRRKESETGRNPCEKSSRIKKKQMETSIRGANASLATKLSPGRLVIGPMKCFKYATPCSRMPMMLKPMKEHKASPTVVLRLPVGGAKPGTRPSKLLSKIKKKKVPKN